MNKVILELKTEHQLKLTSILPAPLFSSIAAGFVLWIQRVTMLIHSYFPTLLAGLQPHKRRTKFRQNYAQFGHRMGTSLDAIIPPCPGSSSADLV